MSPRAVLVGAPGSGKTTVGRQLAKALGCTFRDTDADVETAAGKPIADIFADDGEAAFREQETAAIRRALAEHDGVLALGGGAVLADTNRRLLGGHTVVLLDVGVAEGVRRAGLSTARPLLAGVNPRATYRTLLAERRALYLAVASIQIDTDELPPSSVVSEIVERMGATAPGERAQPS